MSTIFKIPDNDDCIKLLHLIRYLQEKENIDVRPKFIVERNFPDYIEGVVPSLMVEDNVYCGLKEIVLYYESSLGLRNLLERSEAFQKKYRTKNN